MKKKIVVKKCFCCPNYVSCNAVVQPLSKPPQGCPLEDDRTEALEARVAELEGLLAEAYGYTTAPKTCCLSVSTRRSERRSMDRHWCMCTNISAVARDGWSTCIVCGGKDAYGKSNDRPVDKRKTLETDATGKQQSDNSHICRGCGSRVVGTCWSCVGDGGLER